ncbi:aminotransferase class V-fold PLP-dependent enzyme [Candidatus Woesearchaeota archaeon]|nr:aminotransferase class V-fold PLP-dependent enzyme [Candidatus Woesearchaeota archaeon]
MLEVIKTLVNKKFTVLTASGDHAILAVLKHLKNKINTVLIQDQGGWLTYRDYAKKQKLTVVELKTDYGIIELKDLEQKAGDKSALLVNSLTGYCAEQPMNEIYEICKTKKCLLINDASGSIGTENAKIGDIILGSFGKDKPVNLHYGGFIATDEEITLEGQFDETKCEALEKELTILKGKLNTWNKTTNKIKQDLATFDIIHRNKNGINVIVKFNNEQEKQQLIDYCNKNNYEYTLCPRYIRVMENAVSIEVKKS